jgi:hypothetical protein
MRVFLLTVVLLCSGAPIAAQEGASLSEVEALSAQGLITEARETLETWWTTRFSSASRLDRQRGIWLRGKLTVDPSMAELDFRRLVLEYPGGPYSDDALVRLALASDLRGELREADRFFQKVIREYPSSPRVPEARAWIRAHAQEIAALPEVEETPAPVLPNAPRTDALDEPAEAEGRGDYSVQLGAFRSLDRAIALAAQLRDLGYQPRVVRTPGNDLAKVRIGRFPGRDRAETLARELEARDLVVSLVTDAGDEEPVGGSFFPA